MVDVRHTYLAPPTGSDGATANLIVVMVIYGLPVDVVYRAPADASPPDSILYAPA